jgi:hypothetical protein
VTNRRKFVSIPHEVGYRKLMNSVHYKRELEPEAKKFLTLRGCAWWKADTLMPMLSATWTSYPPCRCEIHRCKLGFLKRKMYNY